MSDSAPQPDSSATERGQCILAPGVSVRRGDLRFSFSRSSGPGGQAVNKLSTKAELRVNIGDIRGLHDTGRRRLRRLAGKRLTTQGELVFQSDISRSQRINRGDCVERLRELVLRAVTIPKKRKPTRPSKAAKERRLKAKREVSEKKQRRRTKKRPE